MPIRLTRAMNASVWFRIALFVVYAVLVAARMPQILLKGRFWAEEGVVYFLNGRQLPWYDALFAEHSGYLNLAASFATLLAARAVPLEQAPWVSTGFALLIQLCPPLLLLTSGVAWLRPPWAMATALLLLLVATPSAEVWMNAITSQFHLGLCTALILALPLRGTGALPLSGTGALPLSGTGALPLRGTGALPPGGTGALPLRGGDSRDMTAVLRIVLLVIAPLSGPTSVFLTPLFLIRSFIDGSWQRLWQAALLGCAGMVQLLMVLLYPDPNRAFGVGPRLFALVVYVKQILLPLLGTAATQDVTRSLTDAVLSGTTLWFPLIFSTACMAAMIWAAWRSRNSEVRWLLAGGTIIMLMTYFGALGQHVLLLSVTFGDRYSYVPTALFGLALFGIARTAGKWLGGAAAVLVCVLIWTGAQEYLSPGDKFADGSSWQVEIARWKAEPTYFVEFWPGWRWWMGPF